jgi:hypothetical protein
LTRVLAPGETIEIPLQAGTYKVAGELSDKTVIPFFGVRNYTGGETESFFVASGK